PGSTGPTSDWNSRHQWVEACSSIRRTAKRLTDFFYDSYVNIPSGRDTVHHTRRPRLMSEARSTTRFRSTSTSAGPSRIDDREPWSGPSRRRRRAGRCGWKAYGSRRDLAATVAIGEPESLPLGH